MHGLGRDHEAVARPYFGLDARDGELEATGFHES